VSALEQFPLLLAALKEELRCELLNEFARGEWLDQNQSVLGRNIHVRACQRLIRRDSADAYYESNTGRWLLRVTAVDKEIRRRNRMHAEKLPAQPPVEPVPVEPMPLAKTEAEPEDETGIYAKGWYEKLTGGGR